MTVEEYVEVFADDKVRFKRIPKSMDTAGKFRGFHDDDRMIFWGYWDTGELMNVHDTLRGKALFPEPARPIPYIMPFDDSLVYFIQAGGGQIKIGLARDPVTRMRKLQTASPTPLTLLTSCEGGQRLEREYHARFEAHRLHGEWFKPHADILAEIERVKCR